GRHGRGVSCPRCKAQTSINLLNDFRRLLLRAGCLITMRDIRTNTSDGSLRGLQSCPSQLFGIPVVSLLHGSDQGELLSGEVVHHGAGCSADVIDIFEVDELCGCGYRVTAAYDGITASGRDCFPDGERPLFEQFFLIYSCWPIDEKRTGLADGALIFG